MQNGVLKSLSFMFEYIGEMGKERRTLLRWQGGARDVLLAHGRVVARTSVAIASDAMAACRATSGDPRCVVYPFKDGWGRQAWCQRGPPLTTPLLTASLTTSVTGPPSVGRRRPVGTSICRFPKGPTKGRHFRHENGVAWSALGEDWPTMHSLVWVI